MTWPGHLSITGDVGGYTFCRLRDMFEFFRGGQINPGYWGEKLVSHSGYKSYSCHYLFRREVTRAYETAKDCLDSPKKVWTQIEDCVLDFAEYEPEARQALESFECDGFSFVDTFEGSSQSRV